MPSDRQIDVDGLALRLRVWPGPDVASPPVLLVPGTAATVDDWDVVAAQLSQQRTAVAVDLRGHGSSDWPGTYSMALFADDLRGVLERLGAGPVHLVGHSLGGLVACRVAAAIPDLVRTLVLEDVGVLHPRPAAMPERPAGRLPYDWAMVEQIRPEIDRPDDTWPSVIAGITAPTLIIGGGPTSFVPQEHLSELRHRLFDAQLVTIDAGHLIHTHRPDDFIGLVRAFLEACEADATSPERTNTSGSVTND